MVNLANVDGAVARSQNKWCSIIAVGVVFRDEHGVYRGASSVVFDGVCDPTTLEAYACREALSLAGDMQIHEVSIASYCLTVVKEISEGGSRSSVAWS
jgi:ribonuclease HI